MLAGQSGITDLNNCFIYDSCLNIFGDLLLEYDTYILGKKYNKVFRVLI